MKKIIKYTFLLLILSIIIWVVINFKNLSAFPSIISSYYSKEFCSCYFIEEHTEEYCHDFVKQYVPISSFQLNKELKLVEAKGLGVKTKAFFKESEGCSLEKY